MVKNERQWKRERERQKERARERGNGGATWGNQGNGTYRGRKGWLDARYAQCDACLLVLEGGDIHKVAHRSFMPLFGLFARLNLFPFHLENSLAAKHWHHSVRYFCSLPMKRQRQSVWGRGNKCFSSTKDARRSRIRKIGMKKNRVTFFKVSTLKTNGKWIWRWENNFSWLSEDEKWINQWDVLVPSNCQKN